MILTATPTTQSHHTPLHTLTFTPTPTPTPTTHLGDGVTDADRLQVRCDVAEQRALLPTREGQGRVTVVGTNLTKESPRRVGDVRGSDVRGSDVRGVM